MTKKRKIYAILVFIRSITAEPNGIIRCGRVCIKLFTSLVRIIYSEFSVRRGPVTGHANRIAFALNSRTLHARSVQSTQRNAISNQLASIFASFFALVFFCLYRFPFCFIFMSATDHTEPIAARTRPAVIILPPREIIYRVSKYG